MKAVYLTAGAAGMYCGSCMHDNSLARAMRDQGVDCVLQPIYTPIRTDSDSIADQHVFFGGIHIYLLQQMPWLRHVPTPIRRTLDWAPLVRLASRLAHATDAAMLGQLTISMLKGSEGSQAVEVERLVGWLAHQIQPRAVLLSNLLIGGALPVIRRRLPDARLVVLLQGDDIFLDHLPPPEKAEVIGLCRELVQCVDRFVVNSQFYAEKMGRLLGLPPDKIVVTPLSIDMKPFLENHGDAATKPGNEFRLGYLARVAPEKGLHQLVDAFIQLAAKPLHDDVMLHVAGWLGENNKAYFQTQQRKLEDAGLLHRFAYHGSPDLNDKIRFLRSLDLFCVPTDYEEPKGLFVLESLAAGVPVVQPDHGAFGELVSATGGGVLVEPGNIDELCKAIEKLEADRELRKQLGKQGAQRVHSDHTIEKAAQQMKKILFA